MKSFPAEIFTSPFCLFSRFVVNAPRSVARRSTAFDSLVLKMIDIDAIVGKIMGGISTKPLLAIPILWLI